MNNVNKLNCYNDPLLFGNKLTINDNINIYGILMKKEDFENNKKGAILKKCPYIYDEDNEIEKIIHKLKDQNYIKIRQLLSDYLKTKRIRKDTFENWLKQRIYPLPLIRVLFQELNKDIVDIIKNKKITDFCNQSKIKLPTNIQEISSDFMAYFVGLHLGDGTLNEERWKITDGDRESRNLIYSWNFLHKIKKKLKKRFYITSSKIYKIKNKNAYSLQINNKWFCRFLKYVYDVEYGEKQNPRVSYLFEKKSRLVLRGLFDTDGSIKYYRINIGTKYKVLYNWIVGILEKEKIEYKKKINDTNKRNTLYCVEIKKESIKPFLNKIGFSHPRKMQEIEKYLLTTSASSKFVGYKKGYSPKIGKEDLEYLCKFIRPIKNAGKIYFLSKFNKLKKAKKKEILENFRLNFNIRKSPDKKGYIYSYRIEKILTKYFIYEKKRKRSEKSIIDSLIKKLDNIWF